MVSVIVLTYNQENTIARTLDSILRQRTNCKYEIIIGDDCSQDRTRSICEDYVKKHPDVIKLNEKHPNYGIVKNYREALSRCSGEYIQGCAGDDWWHNEGKMQLQVEYMESHPSCVACHTGFREYIVSTNTYIEKHPIRIEGGDQLRFILRCNPVCAPTACVRKSVLDKMDFNTIVSNGFLVEDYPIWLGISPYGTIDEIDLSCVTYSIYSGSVHNVNDYEKRCRHIDDFHRMRLYYVSKAGRDHELKDMIEDIYLTQKGETAIKFGKRGDALKSFNQIKNRNIKVVLKTIICRIPFLFNIMKRRYNKNL